MPGITWTLWLDPQWELALDALAPHIEAALDEGLISEADVAEIVWKGAVAPNLRLEVD
jgi:hypothetical protein